MKFFEVKSKTKIFSVIIIIGMLVLYVCTYRAEGLIKVVSDIALIFFTIFLSTFISVLLIDSEKYNDIVKNLFVNGWITNEYLDAINVDVKNKYKVPGSGVQNVVKMCLVVSD